MPILTVTLASGRTIWASELHLQNTYAHLLEGYPIAKLNDRLIAALPGRGIKLFGDAPVHVIAPPRTVRDTPQHAPFGPAEHLPSCWMAAEFESTPVGDDGESSHLIVFWFQDQPFPPSESSLQSLQQVEWDKLARDFSN